MQSAVQHSLLLYLTLRVVIVPCLLLCAPVRKVLAVTAESHAVMLHSAVQHSLLLYLTLRVVIVPCLLLCAPVRKVLAVTAESHAVMLHNIANPCVF